MSATLTLFDYARPTLQERFEQFLAAHPDVYAQFVQIALDLKRRGLPRYSADGVGHILRWQRLTSTQGGSALDGWKINNDHISRMSRLAMLEHPELRGFFETRRLLTEE